MGKIIVVESNTDGAGKQTQTEEIYKYLKEKGEKVVKFSFPNYNSDSSYFVKKYLNGEFGDDAKNINAYIASTFFAVDRYLTYIKEIKKYYDEDYYILMDRYVTSNIIYQAAKMENKNKIDEFINWNKELEYNKYNLPKPNYVIFLYMDLKESEKLRKSRKAKLEGKDIHEQNNEYLKKVSDNSLYICETEKWIKIECVKNDKLKEILEIKEEILKKIKI
ncbi:MAG: thymidylate kinase [Clostridiales bacterium]|nr:thymidylate kinase [Clostridiales bacterium]